jgi:hypothetical protein
MWCWRRLEKTSWTDRVRFEEISYIFGGNKYPTYNKKEEE